jgi:Ni/Co efflux regulator RcnB
MKKLLVALIAVAFTAGAYAQAPKPEGTPDPATKSEKAEKKAKKAKGEKKAKKAKSEAKKDEMKKDTK